MTGMSEVWEGTDGCAKKYRCALAKYLMTVLKISYGIIMDCAINAPGNGKNIVDGLNVREFFYLMGKIELIDKLGSNDTTKIGMLTSA